MNGWKKYADVQDEKNQVMTTNVWLEQVSLNVILKPYFRFDQSGYVIY